LLSSLWHSVSIIAYYICICGDRLWAANSLLGRMFWKSAARDGLHAALLALCGGLPWFDLFVAGFCSVCGCAHVLRLCFLPSALRLCAILFLRRKGDICGIVTRYDVDNVGEAASGGKCRRTCVRAPLGARWHSRALLNFRRVTARRHRSYSNIQARHGENGSAWRGAADRQPVG